jgi:hypothetical protein
MPTDGAVVMPIGKGARLILLNDPLAVDVGDGSDIAGGERKRQFLEMRLTVTTTVKAENRHFEFTSTG